MNFFLQHGSGYQDIDGVLWGWCWKADLDGHTRLTFSFPNSTADYVGYSGFTGFEAFNDQQQAAARKVLALYDAVCNVDFTFTTNSSSANIRMAEVDAVDVGTGLISIGHAYGIAPDPNNAPAFSWGDTWFDHVNYNEPVLGGFAFACGLMHEIGHALGLKHGHLTQPVKDASGVIWWTAPALSFDHNSLEYTIMTYRSYPGAPADKIYADELPFHADAGRHHRAAISLRRELSV